MTDTRTDRRVERTRKALMSAFVNLVLSRGYEGLTVDGIAAHANVGRSTFYLHFKSREDILLVSLARPSTLLAALFSQDVGIGQLVPLLEHFKEQRKLNHALFEPMVRTIWIKCLAAMIEPAVKRVRRRARGLPPALIASHIAEAQIALVANWLRTSPQIKSELVAEALIATTRANRLALAAEAPAIDA